MAVKAFGGNNTSGAVDVSTALSAHGGPHGRQDFESETFIAHTLRGEGYDASEDGSGRGVPLVVCTLQANGKAAGSATSQDADSGLLIPMCFDPRQSDVLVHGDKSGPLDTGFPGPAICFTSKDHGADAEVDLSPTLRAGGHHASHANAGVPPAIAYSIMPQNSGKDYKARVVDVAQPVMAAGPAGGNQGGDYIVTPILEAGARTGVSTTDARAGSGIGDPGDPMFTLQAGKQHAVAFALRGREEGAMPEVEGDGDTVGTLRAADGGSSRDYVAFAQNTRDEVRMLGGDGAISGALGAQEGMKQRTYLAGPMVRRLTVRECARLQGFDDDWTQIEWGGKSADLCPDGPQYKAFGNSWAVPVARWVGTRIAAELARTAADSVCPDARDERALLEGARCA